MGVQTGRITLLKAEHAAYVSEIEKQVAENKAKAALETARINANAAEALDDLQNRYAALDARYRVLRSTRSPSAVPSLSEATGITKSCPGEPDKPNPALGQVERLEAGIEEILRFGDEQIARHVELWKLQKENSAK